LEINCGYLGDSGVGKTSFIQRFCRDNFNETFSATVGIDLQVKMLNIDNRIIALQLWDTVKINFLFVFYFILFFFKAGQERFVRYLVRNFKYLLLNIRFRSITKQYFRKSDGIILIYDITSEITFRNVREWMTSIQVLKNQFFFFKFKIIFIGIS